MDVSVVRCPENDNTPQHIDWKVDITLLGLQVKRLKMEQFHHRPTIWQINEQNVIMMHNYMSRPFHSTWNEENLSSCSRDMHSGPWISSYESNGQMPKTLHNYKFKQFDRILNGENPSSSFRDMHFGPWAGPYGSNGHIISGDNSIEFRTEKICPAVSEIYFPQSLDQLPACLPRYTPARPATRQGW